MRLVFAGTPPFAASALRALHVAGHDVGLVLTRPDRPSGRGLKPSPSPVAALAGILRLRIAKPASLESTETRAAIEAAAPHVMVVAAYGLMVPPTILAIPRKGCLNIHASLLPRWRGAAPIPRAIEAGDTETGIAIMVMEPSLDTGPVLRLDRLPILATDTAGTLTDKLAELGAKAVVETLDQLDSLAPRAQDPSRATYAAKIRRSEAALDWQLRAIELDRKIRAFNPFPGAETGLEGNRLKIWASEPVEANGLPGTVIGCDRGRPVVACGSGALVLTIIQRPGSHRMPAAEFLRGYPIPTGTLLAPLAKMPLERGN